MKSGVWIGLIIGLVSLYALFYYFIFEGFQTGVGDTGSQRLENLLSALRGGVGDRPVQRLQSVIEQEAKCATVMTLYAIGPDQGKPDILNTRDKCVQCLAIDGCGWAPIKQGYRMKDGTQVPSGVGVCIPRNGQYPIPPEFLVDFLRKNVNDPRGDYDAMFNQNTFVYSKSQCGGSTTCGSINNCKDCISNAKSLCTWSLDGGSGSGSGGMCVDTTSTTTGPRYVLAGEHSKCPLPDCTTITDCVQCSQQTGCGFCGTTSKCVNVDGLGNDKNTGAGKCEQGNIIKQAYQCPCEGITDCAQCAARPGCGFCGTAVNDPTKGSSKTKCVNLMDFNTGREKYIRINGANGMPIGNINNLCAPNGFLTSAAQCGAGYAGQIRNVRSERGSIYYRPSADELSMISENNPLFAKDVPIDLATQGSNAIGTGAGAVSPAKTWKTVSGNANVVGLGTTPQTSMWNNGGLYATPLESYIKLLVRSEMAAEGVPLNEPFQVNETSAIGNATDYLKKVFRGVV
jgi:hypothetical protein